MNYLVLDLEMCGVAKHSVQINFITQQRLFRSVQCF